MSTTRINITISTETAELLRRERELSEARFSRGLNVSAVCERAIREAVVASLEHLGES